MTDSLTGCLRQHVHLLAGVCLIRHVTNLTPRHPWYEMPVLKSKSANNETDRILFGVAHQVGRPTCMITVDQSGLIYL